MKFDENFLQEVGLSNMPEEEKRNFLAYIQEEVETRIGYRISQGLSVAQLTEFDNITDQAEATSWLERNRPDYKEIVKNIITELKNEIATNREKLL